MKWFGVLLFLGVVFLSVSQAKTMWGARKKRDLEEKYSSSSSLEHTTRKSGKTNRRGVGFPSDTLSSTMDSMDQYLAQIEIVLRSKSFRDNFKPQAMRTISNFFSDSVEIPVVKNIVETLKNEDIDEFVKAMLETVQNLRANKRDIRNLISDPIQLRELFDEIPSEYSDLLQALVSGDFEATKKEFIRFLPMEYRVAVRNAFRGDFSLLKEALLESDLLDEESKNLVEKFLGGDFRMDEIINEIQRTLGSSQDLEEQMQNIMNSPELAEMMKIAQVDADDLKTYVEQLLPGIVNGRNVFGAA